ncbi:hypothetical protein BDV96DRAFT_327346 [Lophiotrema nucula]|uniref:Uncharacterized protein n=1 Tax=Lophiotrema nucula TaxID=690887 RepID=A0A6A5YIN8_9PLEO|nr:hypothetical protein BDV96DRAFT_327346 [Lophiotrema nucula]
MKVSFVLAIFSAGLALAAPGAVCSTRSSLLLPYAYKLPSDRRCTCTHRRLSSPHEAGNANLISRSPSSAQLRRFASMIKLPRPPASSAHARPISATPSALAFRGAAAAPERQR